MPRRVAITGMGVISPLGNDVDTLFTRVAAGESAIRQLALPRFGPRPVLGAQAEFDGAAHFEGMKLRMLDRVSQMALVAAGQAIAESGLDFAQEDPERCGVSVGSSLGGAQTSDEGYFGLYGERSDRVQPLNVVAGMSDAPAAWIAIEHALAGPALTYSTACSSSAVAIGEAARRIQFADFDVMIAGGAEAPLGRRRDACVGSHAHARRAGCRRRFRIVPSVCEDAHGTRDRGGCRVPRARGMGARAGQRRCDPRGAFGLWPHE